jgi:leucyl/phenylalanyl-tRNA--protein transferase
MIRWLYPGDPFPSVSAALRHPNGLLAASDDLSPARLLDAYRCGIFPWYSEGQPVLWWSPDPRMVLFPSELRVSRSLRKALRRGDYVVRVDMSFGAVMHACAEPRPGQDGTWITQEIIDGYSALHAAGTAHSVETWIGDQLAGGLYGIALGKVFFGESMFTRVADASKIAFAHLVRQLERWGFEMIDCQMSTAHLATLGAREIRRGEFVRRLAELVNCPGREERWTFDDDLAQ